MSGLRRIFPLFPRAACSLPRLLGSVLDRLLQSRCPARTVPYLSTTSTCSSTRATWSSESDFEEHNVWNNVLGLCFQFQVGPLREDVLSMEDLGRLALSCRFALDISCDTCSRQPGPDPSAGSSNKATLYEATQLRDQCLGAQCTLLVSLEPATALRSWLTSALLSRSQFVFAIVNVVCSPHVVKFSCGWFLLSFVEWRK